MAATDDLYEVLQVSRSASGEVIEAAYRRLARIYHSDVNSSPTSNAMMRRLNHAYQTLSDTKNRLADDLTGPRPAQQYGGASSRGAQQSAGSSQNNPSKSPLLMPVTAALFVLLLVVVAVTQGYVSIPWLNSGGDSLASDLPVTGSAADTTVAPPTATSGSLGTPEPTVTEAPSVSPTPALTPGESTPISPSEQVAQLLAGMATGESAVIEVSVDDPVLETELQNAIRRQGGTITGVNLNVAQTAHIVRFTK
jgi:hypothetical protein